MSKNRKRRLRPLPLLIILVVLIAMTGLLGWWGYHRALAAVDEESNEVVFTIEPGQSFGEVLDQLQKDDLIQSAWVASLYGKFHGLNNQYAGDYVISADMSTPEILAYLSNPDNIDQGFEIITFPEGFWAKQVAERLSENFTEYTEQEFIDLWNNETYLNSLAEQYDFFDPQQISDEVFVKLEGYLYPETYYFDPDSTPEMITGMFLDAFQEVYDQYQDEIEKSDMDLEQILTLASIVEFEAGDPEDMADVAGVFYNRLESGMRLESSVTVCYALYDEFENAQDCEVNYQIDSPYNSYLVDGLPAGPVLNPSASAIEAVLNPADNDYLYFVADIYGDGQIHYATTYEEHLENIEQYNLSIE